MTTINATIPVAVAAGAVVVGTVKKVRNYRFNKAYADYNKSEFARLTDECAAINKQNRREGHPLRWTVIEREDGQFIAKPNM